MKKNRIYKANLILLMMLSLASAATAQKSDRHGQLKIHLHEIRQRGDSLYIRMDVNMAGVFIETDRSMTLTPFLSTPERDKYLPAIVLNGKDRHKIHIRELMIPSGPKRLHNEMPYEVVQAGDPFRLLVHYSLSLPFESWMKNARFNMEQEFCGCGGYTQQVALIKLADKILPERVVKQVLPQQMQLKVAYIRPPVEQVKMRSESHEVYLDFPVAQTTIYPNFGNNYTELTKIEKFIRDIHNDKNIKFTRVHIVGNASPEGNTRYNDQLAGGRAEALRNFLSTRINIPFDVFNVESRGEDWEGLARIVEQANISNKQDVLAIIRYTYPVEARKTQLKRVDGGRLYQYLLNNIYPRLRRVTCRIEFTVRGFVVDEAKEIIRSKPQQLSLEEMYMVANTYPVSSKAFTEVFETAVRLHPADPIANLNAAATALMKKDLALAEQHLSRSDKSSGEYMNNLGIYYLLKKEYANARRCFTEAAKRGLPVAGENLRGMGRKATTPVGKIKSNNNK